MRTLALSEMAGVHRSSAALQWELSHTAPSLQVNDLSSRWKNKRSSFAAPPWNTKTRQAEGGGHTPLLEGCALQGQAKPNQRKPQSVITQEQEGVCALQSEDQAFREKTCAQDTGALLSEVQRGKQSSAPQGQPAGGGTGHTSHFHLERISERPPRKRLPTATHFLPASTCLSALSSPVHSFAHSLIHSDTQ